MTLNEASVLGADEKPPSRCTGCGGQIMGQPAMAWGEYDEDGYIHLYPIDCKTRGKCPQGLGKHGIVPASDWENRFIVDDVGVKKAKKKIEMNDIGYVFSKYGYQQRDDVQEDYVGAYVCEKCRVRWRPNLLCKCDKGEGVELKLYDRKGNLRTVNASFIEAVKAKMEALKLLLKASRKQYNSTDNEDTKSRLRKEGWKIHDAIMRLRKYLDDPIEHEGGSFMVELNAEEFEAEIASGLHECDACGKRTETYYDEVWSDMYCREACARGKPQKCRGSCGKNGWDVEFNFVNHRGFSNRPSIDSIYGVTIYCNDCRVGFYGDMRNEIYEQEPDRGESKELRAEGCNCDGGYCNCGGLINAESFEAPRRENTCTHRYEDTEGEAFSDYSAWKMRYSDVEVGDGSSGYVETGVRCDICGQERVGSWAIESPKEGFQITKGEEGRMPRSYGWTSVNEMFGAEGCNCDGGYCNCGGLINAEEFEAQRIQYDYMVHREPSGTEVGADGKRITNPRGGRFTSADAESFAATKGIDTYSQPFKEMNIGSTTKKVATFVAAMIGGGAIYSHLTKRGE